MSRRSAAALLCSLWAAAHAGAPAGAQAPPITLYVPLHSATVAIVGAARQPTVRLLYADGGVRAVPVSIEPTADGNWVASFNLATTLQDRLLIEPGDILEASAGGEPVRVTVPELSATVDAATDTVAGMAPGFAAVLVQPHYDPDWYPGQADPAGEVVLVSPDGSFSSTPTGGFDFGPGAWGEVLIQDSAGHVFASDFAVAYATAYWDQPLIVLRADPTLAPAMVSRGSGGATSFRIQAIPYVGSLFFVPLFDPNDPQDEPQPLEPGETLAAEADGRTLFEAPLPHIAAGLDRPLRVALGFAGSGDRIRVQLRALAGATPLATGTASSGADGAWRLPFEVADLTSTSEVDVLAVPSAGAVAHHTTGRALGFSASLFSQRLSGTLLGRGQTALTHTQAEGMVGSGSASTDPVGRFEVELFQPGGVPDRIAPGGTVVAAPAWGSAHQARVPRVTAAVMADLRVIEGEAPPGAAVSARVYTTPVDFFMADPYERPYIEVAGRADATGRYRLTCPAADCAAHYGMVDADDGRFVARILWIAAPTSEVDVTRGVLRGYATAGAPVTLSLGGALQREALSTPPRGRGLPGWTIDASDVFTTGLPAGTSLRLDVGGSPVAMAVPPLSWQPDTAADVVTGTGPPGRFLYVVAVPPLGDASREPAVAAIAIDARGAWRVTFPGFDFKRGDGLELLMPYPSLLVRWFEDGVAGNDPPSPTPGPTTPSPVPPMGTAYLPALRHP